MQTIKNADVLRQTIKLDQKAVLDIGCGEGHLTRMMAREGAKAIGLESSATQLAKAKSFQVKLFLPLIHAVGQTLPFQDKSFEYLVFFNSLHHIPSNLHKDCFLEANRVLKDEGCIYISEPIAQGPHFQLLKPIEDETEVRAKAYHSIYAANEQGFQLYDEKIYNHPVKRKSFEELRDKLIGPNPERAIIFEERDHDLRTMFNTLGVLQEDGTRLFDQPTRMNLLQKK